MIDSGMINFVKQSASKEELLKHESVIEKLAGLRLVNGAGGNCLKMV